MTVEIDDVEYLSQLERNVLALDAQGLSLIPLKDKAGYLRIKKMGDVAAQKVIEEIRSGKANCYGIRLASLVVVDIDNHDEALLQRMLKMYGPTPIWTKTVSGYHLWYKTPNGQIYTDKSPPEDKIDIKSGPNEHVVGHGCVRSDGGEYVLQANAFRLADIPAIKSGASQEGPRPKAREATSGKPISRNVAGQVREGSRHRYLVLRGKDMAEHVDSQHELYVNLLHERDACENSASSPDDEVMGIAEYWWQWRWHNKIFSKQNRFIRIADNALQRLAGNSHATALYVFLVRSHAHNKGKSFLLDYKAIKAAGKTDLSRERFIAARNKLIAVGLLQIAANHRAGKRRRQYRLAPHPL